MRRGRREKVVKNRFKNVAYLSFGIIFIILISFIITIVVYNNNLKKTSQSMLTTEKIADLVPNTEDFLNETNNNLEEASTNIGKSIEEAIEELEEKNKAKEVSEKEVNSIKNDNETNNENKSIETNSKIEIVKDPEFIKPVDGEIIRNYAKDSLIYSNTLEEWITHLGIDIKADRTSIVKSAEAGKVLAIKNDPRYGLTIIIEHTNGYRTIYSNLLSAEFIKEGESVEKGQTIGTVGNSASFEILDEPHLHFEILKDDINVDPNLYLK